MVQLGVLCRGRFLHARIQQARCRGSNAPANAHSAMHCRQRPANVDGGRSWTLSRVRRGRAPQPVTSASRRRCRHCAAGTRAEGAVLAVGPCRCCSDELRYHTAGRRAEVVSSLQGRTVPGASTLHVPAHPQRACTNSPSALIWTGSPPSATSRWCAFSVQAMGLASRDSELISAAYGSADHLQRLTTTKVSCSKQSLCA